MRLEKYVDEKFGGEYFTFGGDPAKGRVDVASTHYDTLVTVSPEDADRLIADRAKIMRAMVAMAEAFNAADHEAFSQFWYHGPLDDALKPCL